MGSIEPREGIRSGNLGTVGVKDVKREEGVDMSEYKARGSKREQWWRKKPAKLTGEDPEKRVLRSNEQRARVRIQCTSWSLG